ncbi:MAG: hypothetical protein AB7K41_07805 [Bdellovibrionales bacterium]
MSQDNQNGRLDYDGLITQPAGDREILHVAIGAQILSFDVLSQVEWERRINLADRQRSGLDHAGSLLGNFYGSQYQMMKGKTYGGAMVPPHWQGRIQLQPLRSIYEHFHDGGMATVRGPGSRRMVNQWGEGETPDGALVDTLYGSRISLRPLDSRFRDPGSNPWSDYVETTYLVGRQSELGLYFDTEDGLLERSGVAARLKLWSSKQHELGSPHRAPQDSELEHVVQRMVTIKKNLGEQQGFTRRQEIQGVWPKDRPVMESVHLIREILIHKLGFKPEQLETLQARRRVDNQRIGINLIDTDGDKEDKLGFMTVDRFYVHDLKTGLLLTKQPVNQLELEIFPQLSTAIFADSKLRQDLAEFVAEVESFAGGKKTTQPKYKHADVPL